MQSTRPDRLSLMIRSGAWRVSLTSLLFAAAFSLYASVLPAQTQPPEKVDQCDELMKHDLSSAPNGTLVRDALATGYTTQDPVCLAFVALHLASQDRCELSLQAANRSVELAPGDPTATLSRGVAHACSLSAGAAVEGRGVPVICNRQALQDAVFDLGRGALLSDIPDVGEYVARIIDHDLAKRCRDDDGLLLATMRTISAVQGVRSDALQRLNSPPGIPWGLSGASLLPSFDRFMASNGSDIDADGRSALRAQARAWLLAATRGHPSAFTLEATQKVAVTLLMTDSHLARSSMNSGFFLEDLGLVGRTGGLAQELVMTAASRLCPTWLLDTPLPEETLSLLREIDEQVDAHRRTRNGPLLALKVGLALAIRGDKGPSCESARRVDDQLNRFAGGGAQTVVTEAWLELVSAAARVGLMSAKECADGHTLVRHFQEIAESASQGLNPWPATHLLSP